MPTAKVFWSGRSQAVRLPKEFRFKGEQVRIRRHGAAVILEPIPADWSWLDALAGAVDDDFKRAATEQPAPQERPALDKVFSSNPRRRSALAALKASPRRAPPRLLP